MREDDAEKFSLKFRKRFEIIKELGSGAAAKVFLAVDNDYGDYQVALKVLRTDADYDVGAVRRFCEEHKILCKIQHPNLVEAYALIEEGDSLAYTMEYIEGKSLLEAATVDKLPIEKVCLIIAQVLSALAILHEHGIAHRDIKLENVLLRSDGLAKLSDLGLLKSYGRISQTRSGVLLGTTHYFPPEYIQYGIYDAQSDLYAVGLLLYECLIGKRWLEAKDSAEALKLVAEKGFVFPKMALVGLPNKFRRILERALDPEPMHRFTSASEMRMAVLSERGTADPETIVAAHETGAFSSDFFSAHLVEDQAAQRRRRRVATASFSASIAGIATLILGVIGSPLIPEAAHHKSTPAEMRIWSGTLQPAKGQKRKIAIADRGDAFMLIDGMTKEEETRCPKNAYYPFGQEINCSKESSISITRTGLQQLVFSYQQNISEKNTQRAQVVLK